MDFNRDCPGPWMWGFIFRRVIVVGTECAVEFREGDARNGYSLDRHLVCFTRSNGFVAYGLQRGVFVSVIRPLSGTVCTHAWLFYCSLCVRSHVCFEQTKSVWDTPLPHCFFRSAKDVQATAGVLPG